MYENFGGFEPVKVKTIEERGNRFSLRMVGAMALMLALAIFLASCAEEEQGGASTTGASTTPEEEPESEGPASGVVVSDITDNPSEYFGSTVTISGEVNDLAGPQAFTIGGEDFSAPMSCSSWVPSNCPT